MGDDSGGKGGLRKSQRLSLFIKARFVTGLKGRYFYRALLRKAEVCTRLHYLVGLVFQGVTVPDVPLD